MIAAMMRPVSSRPSDDWLGATRRQPRRSSGRRGHLSSFLAPGLGDRLRDPPPTGELALGIAGGGGLRRFCCCTSRRPARPAGPARGSSLRLLPSWRGSPRVAFVAAGLVARCSCTSPPAAACASRRRTPRSGSSRRAAACAVIGDAGGVSVDNAGSLALTTFAIGFLMLAFAPPHHHQPRAARRARRARRGSRSPRSGCASPATCTTCSATACR